MRIVADEVIADAANAFAAYGPVTLFDGRRISAADIRDADVLLVRSVTEVNAGLIDGSKVSHVGSATAGIDHVAVDELAERDVRFFHAPGNNANAVAEFVTTLVSIYCHRFQKPTHSLTVGVVGCGEVGSRVVNKLGVLGIRGLINDPPREQRGEPGDYVSLEEALEADIVTLHTPLESAGPFPTVNLIGVSELAQLKVNGLFINCARGGVVDEVALIAHLQSGANTAAAIDCWHNEPDISAALLEQSFIATPHIAGHTIEARLNATAMLCRELDAAFEIENPWLAEHANTADAPLVLAGFNDNDVIRLALEFCCPTRQADAMLRKATGRHSDELHRFDLLRRVFAGRREFSHYRLNENHRESSAFDTLTALGFRV